MKKILFTEILILCAAIFAGCASYTVQNVPSQMDESKVVKAGDNDSSITAFPILSEEDSKKYFDYDLVAKNVLSVYLVIVNHSQNSIQLISSNVVLENDKVVTPCPQKEVYKLVRREYVGKSSFWWFFGLYVGAPISAAHTSGVNTKIEEDINKKILISGEVKPNEFQQGFVWFKLPDDIVLQGLGDKKLLLRVVLKKDGKLINHDLTFSAPKKRE